MEPSRQILWNIQAGWLVYPLMAAPLALLVYAFWRRWRLWRRGQPEPELGSWGSRVRGFLRLALIDLLGQRRLLREPFPGLMHLLLFWGFLALFFGTVVDGLEYWFHLEVRGLPYLIFSLFLDLLGLAFLLGVALAAGRRLLRWPQSLDQTWDDTVILLLLAAIALTGFAIEGARLAADELPSHPGWASWSPGGLAFARLYLALGLGEGSLLVLHRALWWLHIGLVAGGLLYLALAFSKLTHIFIGPANGLLRRRSPKGALRPVPDLDTAESFGAADMSDYTWKQRLGLDACTKCGRCQDNCPAWLTGKPLSPKKVVLDLRRAMERGAKGPPAGSVVSEDELWACTTCRSCQEQCPVYIEHIDQIVELRRYLTLMEARFPEGVGNALRSIEARGHPWRGTQATRTGWTAGLNIKTFPEGGAEYLFWVGCTGALEERSARVTVALARLMQAAGVDFAILGDEEACTGDPARRLGNEYLFRQMAEKNLQTFGKYKVKKIITHCPHCYNTLKNEYPQLGGKYEVFHHSQLLPQWLREGRLKPQAPLDLTMTYHDSCYLGRHNDLYEPPRAALSALPGLRLVEMPRRREKGFCCGGGGGWLWMEEKLGRRINQARAAEAVETLRQAPGGAAGAVATACPYCLQMLGDGLKGVGAEQPALDIAEVVARAVLPSA